MLAEKDDLLSLPLLQRRRGNRRRGQWAQKCVVKCSTLWLSDVCRSWGLGTFQRARRAGDCCALGDAAMGRWGWLLAARVPDVLSFTEVNDLLGHILGVVADALEALGDDH